MRTFLSTFSILTVVWVAVLAGLAWLLLHRGVSTSRTTWTVWQIDIVYPEGADPTQQLLIKWLLLGIVSFGPPLLLSLVWAWLRAPRAA